MENGTTKTCLNGTSIKRKCKGKMSRYTMQTPSMREDIAPTQYSVTPRPRFIPGKGPPVPLV